MKDLEIKAKKFSEKYEIDLKELFKEIIFTLCKNEGNRELTKTESSSLDNIIDNSLMPVIAFTMEGIVFFTKDSFGSKEAHILTIFSVFMDILAASFREFNIDIFETINKDNVGELWEIVRLGKKNADISLLANNFVKKYRKKDK
jgi:hypothetical protein